MGPWDIILWVVVCLHLYNSPYTKVLLRAATLQVVAIMLITLSSKWCVYSQIEENFDIQAIHDFLYYRSVVQTSANIEPRIGQRAVPSRSIVI